MTKPAAKPAPKPRLHNCDGCHKLCARPNAEYYPPNEIQFCRTHMLFLCSVMEILTAGKYPYPPSGYADTEKIFSNVPPARASWQTPIELAGEVRARLIPAKDDGDTLLAEAKYIREYRNLSQAARNALNYISGWKRRFRKNKWGGLVLDENNHPIPVDYAEWLEDRRYNNKRKLQVKGWK